jgi:hypothetical protein
VSANSLTFTTAASSCHRLDASLKELFFDARILPCAAIATPSSVTLRVTLVGSCELVDACLCEGCEPDDPLLWASCVLFALGEGLLLSSLATCVLDAPQPMAQR